MKAKSKKAIASLIILAIAAVFSITAFGAEYLGEGNSSTKLRWSVISNSKYSTEVYSLLPSGHGASSYVPSGVSKINTQSPSNIRCVVSTFNSSNVDLLQPSEDTWDAHGYDYLADAVTIPRSTSGRYYYKLNDVPSSGTIYINYAQIMFHPGNMPHPGNEWISMIMHELCHVYGMGTSGKDSVTSIPGLTQLSAEDISEFRRMYP